MSTALTTILNNFDTLAVFSGGIFAGTTLYLSIGQVPAFREFGHDEHWRFFPHMFDHILIAPASTIIAGIASIVHGTRIQGAPFHRNLWLVAGSTFIAMVPYTYFCLHPINQKILNDNKSIKSGAESKISTATKKELLDKWTVLHFVRTAGAVAGFGAMVYGLSRHSSLILRW